MKEKSSSCIGKTHSFPRCRERLAWKSCTKNIEVGNLLFRYFGYIAIDFFQWMILEKNLNGMAFDFGCENAFRSMPCFRQCHFQT